VTFIRLESRDDSPLFVAFEKIAAMRIGALYISDTEVIPYTEVHLDGGQTFFVKEMPAQIGELADKAKA
jgi:hypothetical protein